MKLAKDYRNIASLYYQNQSSQQNFAKIQDYLGIFCENDPVLFLKQVQGNTHVYEWRSQTMFLNGFTPCLILEVYTDKYLGRSINLQNKNIIKTNVYGNFTLTENKILNKKSGIELLGSL